MTKNNQKILLSTASMTALLGVATAAYADGVSLNYERLSFFEEPLATEVGDVTLELRGTIDLPVSVQLEGDNREDYNFTGNFQVSAETQTANQLTLGAAYFGQYATEDSDDHYTDNVAGYVGGVWGTLIGGNVSGIVREETRRARGVGNAELAFDATYGTLDDLGGSYVGRYGPVVLSGTIDEDANVDVGFMFQRPLGNKDYRFTGRYSEGTYISADGSTVFDTQAVGGVAEFIYGSSTFDLGVGYEDFASTLVDVDRWYVSTGAQTKLGVTSLSLEGHYGEVEGQEEVAASFGAAYDIARGLSVNLGVNYSYAPITVNGISFNDAQETKGIVSLRYSF